MLHFKLVDRGSSVNQEIRAGITCFLTMSYILLVNPQVLTSVGLPSTDVGNSLRYFTFTCLFVYAE
jgi:xanthine/uracil/vitamin C permease (AzgA family)